MSGMEFISEAVKLTEGTEVSGLLEQKETLLSQLEAAQNAGNMETANFFRRELATLEDRLAEQGGVAVELAESTEMSGLLEQKEALQGRLEAAQKAGNTETANYFRGELAKLEEQLAQAGETASGMGKGQEISFGSSREGFSGGHSESYWREKAAEADIKGDIQSRGYYEKRVREAHADYLRRHSK